MARFFNSLKAFFLFPTSQLLRDKWWHRLATVMFWLWLVLFLSQLAPLGIYVLAVEKCQELYGFSSSCYDNGIQLSLSSFSAIQVALTLAKLTLLAYLLAALPSLVYRAVLFVAKGETWKAPDTV